MTELDALLSTLGITFENITHLEKALIHRSYLNESADDLLESNERLEYLGDALLGFVVAEELYRRFPEASEGDLTTFRSSVVQTETLANIARSLKLGSYLLLGKGEEETGGRDKQRNLACALEALFGAVLLDQGFEKTSRLILQLVAEKIDEIGDPRLLKDPKTRLQEITQSINQLLPFYNIIESRGPEHAKIFTVEVSLEGKVLGRGRGESKRAAEQEAARAAIQKLRGDSFA